MSPACCPGCGTPIYLVDPGRPAEQVRCFDCPAPAPLTPSEPADSTFNSTSRPPRSGQTFNLRVR